MSKRRAEYLIGAEITVVRSGREFIASGKGIVPVARGASEARVIAALVQLVLVHNRAAAAKKAGYCCQRCGSFGPAHGHHIEYRSHGGTHEVDNQEWLCYVCHQKEHCGPKVRIV